MLAEYPILAQAQQAVQQVNAQNQIQQTKPLAPYTAVFLYQLLVEVERFQLVHLLLR